MPFLNLMGWSVTRLHPKITFPIPFADADPQVLIQMVTRPVEDPHRSELLPFSFQGGAPWSLGVMVAGSAMAFWGRTLPLTGSFLRRAGQCSSVCVRKGRFLQNIVTSPEKKVLLNPVANITD